MLLLPPSYKVGFKLGRMGPHTGLHQEEGFWARVCKAIFLCGGKGRQGMNAGCRERVRNGGEGRRKGPPCWSTATGVTQMEKHACARDPECACSQPLQPGPPHLSGPLPRPQRRFWGYNCRTVHSGPTTPMPPASSPLLGPGRKKVLRWADSGGNSIEFSFGYILKAKVSWTYSQNG